MEQLRGKNLTAGTTIIEKRNYTEDVVGRVIYGGFDENDFYVVGWRDSNGNDHETHFKPDNWACNIIDNVMFFSRDVDGDDGGTKGPFPDADLYIFVS